MSSRRAPPRPSKHPFFASLLACALLAACGEDTAQEPEPQPDPPPPATSLEWMKRYWEFRVQQNHFSTETLGDVGVKFGIGAVDDLREVGGLLIKPAGVPDGARLHVYSNEDGHTYWVGAQVPAARHDDPWRIDAFHAVFDQYQYFIKNRNDATLTITISEALVELMDSSPDLVTRRPTEEECGRCQHAVYGMLTMAVRAYNYDATGELFFGDGVLFVDGYQRSWNRFVDGVGDTPLWEEGDFTFDWDASGRGTSDHAKARLTEPRLIQIPLDTVGPGEMFVVHSYATAEAADFRHRETYASAYLRDPQSTSGVAMSYTGLTPVDDHER